MLQTQTARARHRMPPPSRVAPPAPRERSGGAVPYDLGARFEIRGEPGRLVQDVLSIGPDADFVATAISYGFEEDRRRPTGLRPGGALGAGGDVSLGAVTLGEIPPLALLDGVRVNPRLERLVFRDVDETGTAARESLRLSNEPVSRGFLAQQSDLERVLQRVKAPESISFLFSLLDTTTGRELQDQPVHNLAALGNTTGERPFRLLARPIVFAASSTVRLQVVERTPDVRGTLFIVLIGYKRLRSCKPLPPPLPGSRVVPFDYVARLELKGIPGRREEVELPICIDGGFTATAIGYGLEIGDLGVPIDPRDDQRTAGQDVRLDRIRLDQLPPATLVDGFRVRRDAIRFAFQNNGTLNAALRPDLLNVVFERLNQPESAMFRYRLFDDGRGIELQNVALNNLAGLGTASGDRPFKQLPAPLRFLPRSTLRVSIDEVFGRGRLYMVFQGYRYVADSRRRS